MDFDKHIRQIALENAVKFKGKADKKAVIGKLLSSSPEAKDQLSTLKIDNIISEVNSLSAKDQQELLKNLNPQYDKEQQEKKRQNRHDDLPPLKDAEKGKFVTRMAPEPSKYCHVGHALSFLINYLYAKMYNGKCILRFDDTNPEKESKVFADSITQDVVEYLDIKPDQTKYASDDIPRFYELAEKLIKGNHAYVCACHSDEISKNRRNMRTCKHVSQTIEENLALWEQMKVGKLPEAVLRLLIDIKHKNAVMRDPVIFRVINQPHFRQGTKYKAWPLYDFESAVEEGLCGVTHVMRSNEFDSRIELQTYISRLLGFPEVKFRHYGRFSITGATTRGREIREGIETGKYLGWDDPRLVTLKALKRKGILKESFYILAKRCGMSKTQSNIDYSVIAAINRQLLDTKAKRYFLLKDPIKIKVQDSPRAKLHLRMHPDIDLGKRKFHVHEEYLIEKQDFDTIPQGELIRLIDNLNFRKQGTTFKYDSSEYSKYKNEGRSIIHFLPDDKDQWQKAEIMMPDAKVITALAEINVQTAAEGEIVQFQRFGFCRLDKKGKIYTFWFAHE